MAHSDAREGKWRGNWRMKWVASTLHTTSEHGVSNNTIADAHTSAASSRLNWRTHRFKWTRPFRRKTKSGFCTCAITFQLASTVTDMDYNQGCKKAFVKVIQICVFKIDNSLILFLFPQILVSIFFYTDHKNNHIADGKRVPLNLNKNLQQYILISKLMFVILSVVVS